MDIKITPSKMCGQINAIASKSYAHRILMCALLSKDNGVIKNAINSKDICATINCLNALGVNVEIKNNNFYLTKGKMQENVVLDCIESGSTLRFILSIVLALSVPCTIIGREGLAKRPLGELINVLKEHGANIDSDSLPLSVSGKLTPGAYTIDGSISSQYITGLLMALPILYGDSEIIVKGNLVSSNYIDITIEVMKLFNVFVEKKENNFKIKGNQQYIFPKDISIQGDWSNAAFWLSLGAINNGIKVSGLELNSSQGDKEILNIIEKMGGKISYENKDIIVEKSKLHGIDIDANNIPDLCPIISILSACATGVTKIKNVDRLKIKETDRLSAIIETLDKMGVKCEYKDNVLTIYGGRIKAFNGKSYNDHRMVMMQAIAASVADGECSIQNIEAIDKSYPTFFEDYKTLGGIYNV